MHQKDAGGHGLKQLVCVLGSSPSPTLTHVVLSPEILVRSFVTV